MTRRLIGIVFVYLDFVEVETPILLRSSPEGAREFLVPTRIQSSFSSSPPEVLDSAPIRSQFLEGDSISYPEHHGYIRPSPSKSKFYALAQSPQQPKQVLIASGCVEKYFQFARCFRDEDGRKDRQPEFTQVDLERAWVSWGPTPEDEARGWRIGGQEVRDTIEGLVRRVWRDVLDVELPAKFQVMTYQDAMARVSKSTRNARSTPWNRILLIANQFACDAVWFRQAGLTIRSGGEFT
jgi:aspartyl-tRNA synthetase